MIKYWDSTKQYLRDREEILKAIDRVGKSGKLVLGYGEEIPKLEENFAKFTKKKHAIMVGAGTQALKIAYKALITPGDEVLAPSNTFVATLDQIVDSGGVLKLVDCDENGLMSYTAAALARTDKTKIIVPVHMEGKVCDVGSSGHVMIEDAAQAIGADGVGFGHVQCYSLFPAKIFGSMGNAGMLTTDDDVLADRFRMIRCNSNIGKNPNMGAELGANLEPDEIQAAVLNIRFKHLQADIDRRAEIANMYNNWLNDLPLRLPFNQHGRVWQDYMLIVGQRDELLAHLLNHGVEGFVPNPRIPNHYYTALKADLPNTDYYINHKLALPCRPEHTDKEIEKVIEVVRDFYDR